MSLGAAPSGRTAASFPKASRLRKRSEFTECQKKGKRVAGRWLVLFSIANVLGRSRWGLSVPKKVGPSVLRNRVKRRLREIARREKGRWTNRDFCILARPGAAQASLSDLREELTSLSERVSSSPSSALTSS